MDFSGWHESTPEFTAAHERALAQFDRCIEVPCYWGTCVQQYDPVEKVIIGGWGSAFCGCDNLPGWNARHPEMRPKPAAAVKARGRHGSRVQRSRHRRREWERMLKDLS